MNLKMRRTAFTLIELLTVMAIITLLIGILTPALGAARDRAKSTAVRAQLNAMEVGLDSFSNEEDKYPPSNALQYVRDINSPVTSPGSVTDWEVGTNATNIVQGAHLLVDALVGRDFLGYDPKPSDSTATPAYNRWTNTNDRRKPYIPVDGVDVSSINDPPEDGFGTVPTFGGYDPQPLIDSVRCRVFRDKFGWPILYYRANPTANQNSPIIQTAAAMTQSDGYYDGNDNAGFTSYDQVSPINQAHRIRDAHLAFPVQTPDYGSSLSNRFAEFIRSIRASTYDTVNPALIKSPRPVKSDRFILLSAGKDGIYGTLDDVGNFSVLSTER